jgi:hypothetical protein
MTDTLPLLTLDLQNWFMPTGFIAFKGGRKLKILACQSVVVVLVDDT